MTSAAMDRPATNRRALLVDDDKALRQSLAEQLRLVESFDCREAETGRGALDIAAKERFDVVLLDIGLPDMDGREVCRLLRPRRRRGADHHADRRRHRCGYHPRPRFWRQ